MWVFTLIGNYSSFGEYFSSLTGMDPEYHLDRVFSAVSGLKLVFVLCLAGLATWMSRIEEHLDSPMIAPRRVYGTVYYIAPIITLIMFIITIVFFLPQYPIYDASPFVKLFV